MIDGNDVTIKANRIFPIATSAKNVLKSSNSNNGVFRDIRIVFSGTPKNLMNELKEKIRILGGEVCDEWKAFGSQQPTHLVCSQCTSMFSHVEQLGGVIVRESWVLDCFLEKRKLDERNYIFHGELDESNIFREPQIFSGLTIFVHGVLKHEDELRNQIILHGGMFAHKVTQQVTHILTENNGTNADVFGLGSPHVCVVDPAWAWESVNKQALLSERVFLCRLDI